MTGPRAEDEPHRSMWPEGDEGDQAYEACSAAYWRAVDEAVDRAMDWDEERWADRERMV